MATQVPHILPQWLAQCRSQSPYSWNWWRNKRFPIGPPLPSKPQQRVPIRKRFFKGFEKPKAFRWLPDLLGDCQNCWRNFWGNTAPKLQWFHTKHLASARSAPFRNPFSTRMLHARLRLRGNLMAISPFLRLAKRLASVHWSSLISLDEHPSHKQPLITRLQGLPLSCRDVLQKDPPSPAQVQLQVWLTLGRWTQGNAVKKCCKDFCARQP